MSEALPDDRRLELSGAIALRDIKDVHQEMLARLKRHDTLEIDCGGVVETDLTLIQLLIAADISATSSGKKIRLVRPYPEAIQQVLARAGFLAGGTEGDQNIWTREP